MDVGELAAEVQELEGFAELLGRFVVFAVVVGPEFVGVGVAVGLANTGGQRSGDGNQGGTGVDAGAGGSDCRGAPALSRGFDLTVGPLPVDVRAAGPAGV